MTGIYIIQNHINRKCYIGSSVNIKKRFRDHRRQLNHNIHANSHLQNAWNKYGKQVFVFWVAELVSKEDLLVREQWWIDQFNPKYNIYKTAGSPTLGQSISEEHRSKIASSVKTTLSKRPTKTHCPNGHVYDKINTLTYTKSKQCRECHRLRVKKDYYKRKLAGKTNLVEVRV